MNDDSNPQQGSSNTNAASSTTCATNKSAERRAFKIPPTKRDERKLFVGGLPANSK